MQIVKAPEPDDRVLAEAAALQADKLQTSSSLERKCSSR
jgi:hypothetical protein